MDLITELNQAIEYIEENLDDKLELEEIAKVTSYSPYHFQRIFNYITGIPLSEYIRKRRLSMAVFDLQEGEKVIDVALKYGYLSADSFTRAFEKQHGMTPSQVKTCPNYGQEFIRNGFRIQAMESAKVHHLNSIMEMPETEMFVVKS